MCCVITDYALHCFQLRLNRMAELLRLDPSATNSHSQMPLLGGSSHGALTGPDSGLCLTMPPEEGVDVGATQLSTQNPYLQQALFPVQSTDVVSSSSSSTNQVTRASSHRYSLAMSCVNAEHELRTDVIKLVLSMLTYMLDWV
jgi:hypothetical protein